MSAQLEVVVVDPMPVVREAVSLFIETQADLRIAGQASDAHEVSNGAALILVALETDPGYDPVENVRVLRERLPDAVIVAMSRDGDRAVVARALAAGADGFIHKRSNPIQFLDGLRRAARGENVMIGLDRHFRWPARLEAGTPAALSKRELEVLGLTAHGLTAKEVGRELRMRERTVTTHLSRIYRKLKVSGKLAAIDAATRLGLLGSPKDDDRTGRSGGRVVVWIAAISAAVELLCRLADAPVWDALPG